MVWLMKFAAIVTVGGLALELSACTSHYDFTTDMATFVQKWNGQVNNDALKFKYNSASSKRSVSTESGVITVVWEPKENRWMAIGSTAAIGELMCTNLMLSATTMDYTWADTALGRAERNGSGADAEGNVRFSINLTAGVASCAVEPAPADG
jgi:hypothetical protein